MAVYAVLNAKIGYCQGMNYLAALILIGVDMREDLAYTIFVKLMNEHDLAGLYDPSLCRLMAMTQQVHQWLSQNEPDLA